MREKVDTPESSNIASIEYEPGTLYVNFRKGGSYRYTDVSYDKFQELKSSSSKGKFLNAEIKPHHPAERVGDEGEAVGV